MSHHQELDDSLLPISLVKSEIVAELSIKYDPPIGDSLQFQKIIAFLSENTIPAGHTYASISREASPFRV